MRCSAGSFGVMAGNTSTTASGSTITKSKLAARKTYSSNLMDPNQMRIPVKLNCENDQPVQKAQLNGNNF